MVDACKGTSWITEYNGFMFILFPTKLLLLITSRYNTHWTVVLLYFLRRARGVLPPPPRRRREAKARFFPCQTTELAANLAAAAAAAQSIYARSLRRRSGANMILSILSARSRSVIYAVFTLSPLLRRNRIHLPKRPLLSWKKSRFSSDSVFFGSREESRLGSARPWFETEGSRDRCGHEVIR